MKYTGTAGILYDRLKSEILVADGAFGTYYAKKYDTGSLPELANLQAPDKVLAIHKEYIEAGAKIIRTNTFASNTVCLGMGFDEVRNNIKNAVDIARKAIKGTDVLVAADIGPIPGENMIEKEHLEEEYVDIVNVFKECGVDIFVFETLVCLQRGLRIILANEDEQRIPQHLNELIKKNNVQLIQMTPSRMQIFLDNIDEIPNLNQLKYVTLAGEALPLRLRDELLKLGVKKVYNGYGPSETTVFSTFTDVTKMNEINIGIPISNTQIYILDRNLNIVHIGFAGELYISGDGVGLGYLNREDLTNERYINNPFFSNSVMYKTGDICKYDNNGQIYYLERADNQVKIRGLRIELEEIENKMLEYPGIKKAKVIKQTIGNREIISAYYIASKRIRITELRKHLYSKLPNYMIPSYFTALDDFPYTPNGKIDKKSLPIPNSILQSEKNNYIAPKTDLEIKLVSIWENILNMKPIGIKDNFFELGGDSILAMNLNVQLLKITNKITYSDIFAYPTIMQLAEKIEEKISNEK